MENTALQKVFDKYSRSSQELKNGAFVKIFKDCKILDSKLKSTDLDIIFSKVKTKGK